MVVQVLAITFLGYVCFNYHRLNIQLKMHAPSEDIRTFCFLEQINSGAVQYSCFYISQIVTFFHLVSLGIALRGLLRYELDSFILVGFFSQLCGQEGYMIVFEQCSLWEDTDCPVKFSGILQFCAPKNQQHPPPLKKKKNYTKPTSNATTKPLLIILYIVNTFWKTMY